MLGLLDEGVTETDKIYAAKKEIPKKGSMHHIKDVPNAKRRAECKALIGKDSGRVYQELQQVEGRQKWEEIYMGGYLCREPQNQGISHGG